MLRVVIALPKSCLGRVQSRGPSASSATCGTERCGRIRPAARARRGAAIRQGRAAASSPKRRWNRSDEADGPRLPRHVRATPRGNAEGEPAMW